MIDDTGSNHVIGGETVGERLVRIETKLDTLLQHAMDHEQRLRKLEDRADSPLRAYATPIAMLAAIASTAVAIWQTITNK
ncbi:hypothetical protein [Streptomyces sp. NPDC048211]|uniref:hypothetical protein n=1 Tax=Streptomyces sp. NPDC048211 TaxID=3365516 RepID=UPI003720C338